jgi:hypothetical protein
MENPLQAIRRNYKNERREEIVFARIKRGYIVSTIINGRE